jgi:hypothetical protein
MLLLIHCTEVKSVFKTRLVGCRTCAFVNTRVSTGSSCCLVLHTLRKDTLFPCLRFVIATTLSAGDINQHRHANDNDDDDDNNNNNINDINNNISI